MRLRLGRLLSILAAADSTPPLGLPGPSGKAGAVGQLVASASGLRNCSKRYLWRLIAEIADIADVADVAWMDSS